MGLKLNVCTLLILFPTTIQAGVECKIVKDQLKELQQVYIAGDFRFFYTSDPESKHFIPDQTDINKNKIPDYVENMAIQANATAALLNQLGFKHPLKSNRYKGSPEYIDFQIQALKGNGLAFETPVINQDSTPTKRKCGLKISIRSNLENFPSTWSIVTHELLHLYQYSYNQFKNSWYLEGMTNSLEPIIRKNVGNKYFQPLPQTTAELNKQVFSVPYNNLWHRLVFLSQKNEGKLKLKNNILDMRYVNGDKVFKDDVISGWLFMLKFLENTQTRSLKISKAEGLNPYNWPEKRQKLTQNNAVLLQEIQNTMREMNMTKTKEEQQFLKLR